MFKTIIFKLENVILDDEILRFKYFEALWFFLRRLEQFREFSTILRLREAFIKRGQRDRVYLTIARRYLTEHDYAKYKDEIRLINRKYLHYYLRLIPGMKDIIQISRFYFQIALFAHNRYLLPIALNRYSLKLNFKYYYQDSDVLDFGQVQAVLEKLLRETHSTADQAILVSNDLETDIAAANQLGIYTILANFGQDIMGAIAHNSREKQYLESLKRIPDSLRRPRNRLQQPGTTVKTSLELARTFQRISSEKEGEPEKQPVNVKQNLMDLLREAMEEPVGEEG